MYAWKCQWTFLAHPTPPPPNPTVMFIVRLCKPLRRLAPGFRLKTKNQHESTPQNAADWAWFNWAGKHKHWLLGASQDWSIPKSCKATQSSKLFLGNSRRSAEAFSESSTFQIQLTQVVWRMHGDLPAYRQWVPWSKSACCIKVKMVAHTHIYMHTNKCI